MSFCKYQRSMVKIRMLHREEMQGTKDSWYMLEVINISYYHLDLLFITTMHRNILHFHRTCLS